MGVSEIRHACKYVPIHHQATSALRGSLHGNRTSFLDLPLSGWFDPSRDHKVTALFGTRAQHLHNIGRFAPRRAGRWAAAELSYLRSNVPGMGDLVSEAAQMPDAARRFARGVDRMWTPEHLVPLRTTVRQRHGAQLRSVHAALDQRFNEPNANWMGVFRAAAEMAVIEQVGRRELKPEDRGLVRQLWTALLHAT
jgi:hypothetical protein